MNFQSLRLGLHGLVRLVFKDEETLDVVILGIDTECDKDLTFEVIRVLNPQSGSGPQSKAGAILADPQDAFRSQGQQKPEQAELTRLKRGVARLKMERDIQKKPWWIQSVVATALERGGR